MKLQVNEFVLLMGIEETEPGALVVLLNDIELPSSISWDMLDFKDEVDKQMKHVVATRIKILSKYGINNKDGSFTIPKERIEEYNKEYSAILKKEITLPDIAPINKNLLMDSKMKVNHLQQLKRYGFITTSEEKKETQPKN